MGNVDIVENENDPTTITLDGHNAEIIAGSNGKDGKIRLTSNNGGHVVHLGTFVTGKDNNIVRSSGIRIFPPQGLPQDPIVRIQTKGTSGAIDVKDGSGLVLRFDGQEATLTIGSAVSSGKIVINNNTGNKRFLFNSESGEMKIRDNNKKDAFLLKSNNAALYLGTTGNEGDLILTDKKGIEVIHLSAGEGVEGKENARFSIIDWNRNPVLDFYSNSGTLYIGNNKTEGDLILRNRQGDDVIHLSAGAGEKDKENARFIVRDWAGDEVLDFNSDSNSLFIGNKVKKKKGDVIVRDNTGKDTIHLNGEAGDILLGNADCAEEFDISELETEHIESGTVMKFDDNGKLKMSDTAYDNRIAGVVSGAGPYKPGIILDRTKAKDKRIPITLLGKVYCKVDAVYSNVNVGDLLTTSATKGYAMKVSDYSKAFGSIIGKAMGTIHSRKGLIPILVSSR